MTRPLAALALVLAAGALLVAGCGGDDEDGGDTGNVSTSATGTAGTAGGNPGRPTGGSPSGPTVEVRMENIEYVPAQVTVRVGQTIEWTNTDTVAHTVTATSGADFDSGTMEVGDKFSFKPTQAGTIQYFCEIHPNQKGTITVQQ